MTESGLLYIPATADRQHGAATVEILEINPPKDEDPEDYFKVGQRVIIGKWQGTEVTVGQGKDRLIVLIINESAVLATIKEETNGDEAESQRADS